MSTRQCFRWQCSFLYSVDYISTYDIIKQKVSFINRLSLHSFSTFCYSNGRDTRGGWDQIENLLRRIVMCLSSGFDIPALTSVTYSQRFFFVVTEARAGLGHCKWFCFYYFFSPLKIAIYSWIYRIFCLLLQTMFSLCRCSLFKCW